ncbi:MAG: CDP-alcohol phosphatidyltransferase family protein [Lachnospiraceae bacterium]|nr:CDP-alcohol phosphatidyltransferase family protein [Lachnospiraceae bacterium]
METQTKDYSNKILTIPNLMSFFRICLIPVCAWLYVEKQNYLWTTIVLILSGLTDIIDGFIARRFNMISNLGKMLDPVADKLTQLVMLICLITRFPLMWAPTILLVIKEFLDTVTGLLVIHKVGVVEGADWHGKVVTFLLYLTIGLHLIWYSIPASVSNLAICVSVVMMIVSLALYSAHRIRLLMKQEK